MVCGVWWCMHGLRKPVGVGTSPEARSHQKFLALATMMPKVAIIEPFSFRMAEHDTRKLETCMERFF